MRTPLTIELVFDRDCPHVEHARAMIRAAMQEVGVPAVWTEWVRESSETPNDLRHFGSPTVLVNGRDVGCDENEAARSEAKACRIYVGTDGRASGAPPVCSIVEAITTQLLVDPARVEGTVAADRRRRETSIGLP